MARYNPTLPFSVAMHLFVPTYIIKKGVKVKQYSETGVLFYGTFKSYGGTEQTVNNVYSIIDTAVIDTWYRPDITSECRIKINDDFYEIINKPENIELRNQYLRFKVKRVDSNV